MAENSMPDAEIILQILLSVGIIVIAAKYLGTTAKKIGLPQVVGEIVAGLLLKFLPFFRCYGAADANIVFREANQFISYMADIGVILIMFSAGLGTNLHSLIKSGFKSTVIAACGVLFPLAAGTAMALGFHCSGGLTQAEFFESVFIGTILTATSVSITVAALQEFGKLRTEIGQTIVSAAIIDDIIGIVVLTIVIGVCTGSGGYLEILVKTAAFFAAAIITGYVIYRIFKWYDRRHPHSRRIPIYGLGVALIFGFCAEKFFGIADITGAYIAGVVFCSLNDAEYMERKIDVNSYMFFSPVFFANIGLKTSLGGMDAAMLLFAAAFVLVGCVSKIAGCGIASRALGYNWRQSLQVGCGMMVRGEVALIVTQKGLSVGLIGPEYFAPVILLIIVSSTAVPVLLKRLFRSESAVPA